MLTYPLLFLVVTGAVTFLTSFTSILDCVEQLNWKNNLFDRRNQTNYSNVSGNSAKITRKMRSNSNILSYFVFVWNVALTKQPQSFRLCTYHV